MKGKKKSLEERLIEIRNNPIHLTIEDMDIKHQKLKHITSEQRNATNFLKIKYGENILFPASIMTTINVSIVRLILFGIFAILSLSLIEFIGSYALLIVFIGGVLGGFGLLQKEMAYFDNDKIVDFRSIDLFKRNYKRKEFLFSEIEQVDFSFYFIKGSKRAIFKIQSKNNPVFKIDMYCSGNHTFVDVLSLKLKERGLLKQKKKG